MIKSIYEVAEQMCDYYCIMPRLAYKFDSDLHEKCDECPLNNYLKEIEKENENEIL